MPLARHWAVWAAAICFAVAPAVAYTPGSGSLYSDDFETADEGWTMANGWPPNPSPWTYVADAGDTPRAEVGQKRREELRRERAEAAAESREMEAAMEGKKQGL